jgi:HAMP domain-containing protein
VFALVLCSKNWLTSAALGFQNLPLGAQDLRLLIAERDNVRIVVANDLSETRSLARDLALGFLAALPLRRLLRGWVDAGWRGRTCGRCRKSPLPPNWVTAEHLDRRVPMPPVADEIQALAKVLNTTLDRLDRSYAQALRFSAAASHGLKTPLSVLRPSLEAIMESPSLRDDDRAALAALVEQAQRLSSITVSLATSCPGYSQKHFKARMRIRTNSNFDGPRVGRGTIEQIKRDPRPASACTTERAHSESYGHTRFACIHSFEQQCSLKGFFHETRHASFMQSQPFIGGENPGHKDDWTFSDGTRECAH